MSIRLMSGVVLGYTLTFVLGTALLELVTLVACLLDLGYAATSPIELHLIVCVDVCCE